MASKGQDKKKIKTTIDPEMGDVKENYLTNAVFEIKTKIKVTKQPTIKKRNRRLAFLI